MYCSHCGVEVMGGQVYCSECGNPLTNTAPAAAMPPSTPPLQPTMDRTGTLSPGAAPTKPSRVAQHVNLLGILWIVYSVLRIIPGLALIGFSHMRFPFLMTPFPGSMRGFLGPLLSVIGAAICVVAIAGIIAGWGLMARQSWARILAIVLACLGLIHFPLGTALGIYTFWVLLSQGADRDYQRLASGA